MQLGDIRNLKIQGIQVGSIFKMVLYPEEGVIPKGEHDKSRTKYFVIVGVDTEGNYIGASLINTNINPNFAPIIKNYQFCISPEKYNFLKEKHRYIDCYMIKSIRKSRIIKEAEYISRLEDSDIEEIQNLLKQSPAMDKKTLQQYGLE